MDNGRRYGMEKDERIKRELQRARDISAVEATKTDDVLDQLQRNYVSGKEQRRRRVRI
jgi:hypothetical protein